jgi:hypothetical protein
MAADTRMIAHATALAANDRALETSLWFCTLCMGSSVGFLRLPPDSALTGGNIVA